MWSWSSRSDHWKNVILKIKIRSRSWSSRSRSDPEVQDCAYLCVLVKQVSPYSLTVKAYVKHFYLVVRGVVESTRLEAKAKDTKKARPSPRTDLPRTDPIEAKDRMFEAKDQGHNAQVFPFQKKGLRAVKFHTKEKKVISTKKKCCPQSMTRNFWGP